MHGPLGPDCEEELLRPFYTVMHDHRVHHIETEAVSSCGVRHHSVDSTPSTVRLLAPFATPSLQNECRKSFNSFHASFLEK